MRWVAGDRQAGRAWLKKRSQYQLGCRRRGVDIPDQRLTENIQRATERRSISAGILEASLHVDRFRTLCDAVRTRSPG